MLFEKKTFTLHAGLLLHWKIECDALTDDDILVIADIIGRNITFSAVHGIPRGGLRLANALLTYRKPTGPILIADDVFTTGMSMEEARSQIPGETIGIVIFARTAPPEWIKTVFQIPDWAS